MYANVELLHHLFHAGERVGLVFEAQNQDAVELARDRVDVGDVGAVGAGIFRGAGGSDFLAARLLRGRQEDGEGGNQEQFLHMNSIGQEDSG